MVKNFYRLQVSDVTEKYIYERNLTTSSLRNYKIALIGCGTIGSQAAALLQKAGAGSGSKGQFDLFDRDILKEGNLGRHLLGAEYLMESKSHAVADFLLKNSSSQLNINAAIGVKVKNLSLLKHYDVVIDATGEETFSCLLASYLSDLRRDDQKLPIVLHTWIDAGGYAVRSLLDDGSGACYRCLKIQKNGADTGALVERYPLFNSVDKEEDMIVVTQRCGESYIPFSAGISSAAAGLVQQMVLEAVSENAGFKFRHQSHASFVKRTQDQNPKKVLIAHAAARD
ncbi:ThiF family adenylyltransferase [Aliamphritea spongicola]|nr:ThiF family adenylyltransferase [Aliamphritea spongicola]